VLGSQCARRNARTHRKAVTDMYLVQKKRFRSNEYETLGTYTTRLEAYDARDSYRALPNAWMDVYRVVKAESGS
jgi:hypothetical protein